MVGTKSIGIIIMNGYGMTDWLLKKCSDERNFKLFKNIVLLLHLYILVSIGKLKKFINLKKLQESAVNFIYKVLWNVDILYIINNI